MKVSVLAASRVQPERADPVKPDAIEAGAWRRFSRLSRLSACALAPVVAAAPEACAAAGFRYDPDAIALYFGTGVGEFLSSFAFLKSLFTRGPAMASPLAFQNSVHNAAPGHMSISFGLRGPSETLCAGQWTVVRTFERAMAAVLADGAPACVVLADDLGADSELGFRFAGVTGPLGEGATAFLIAPPVAGAAELALLPAEADEPLRAPFWPGESESAARLDLPPAFYCTAEAQALVAAFEARRDVRVGFRGDRSALRLRVPG